MRRALLILCLLVLSAPAPAAAATPAASVRLAACVPALEPDDRSATFEARARAVRESVRMQVRFTLQLREEDAGGWRRVVAGGLDEWLSSHPGVRRFSYARTVENLAAPASYRTLVRFRWLDADGAVLKVERATSATCRQTDLRPDLSAPAVSATPAPAIGTRRYEVTVRNAGRSAAGAFAIGLRLGETELPPLALAGLAAGQTRVIAFTGPDCTPELPLTVTVDPEDVVPESNEDDNEPTPNCPA